MPHSNISPIVEAKVVVYFMLITFQLDARSVAHDNVVGDNFFGASWVTIAADAVSFGIEDPIALDIHALNNLVHLNASCVPAIVGIIDIVQFEMATAGDSP